MKNFYKENSYSYNTRKKTLRLVFIKNTFENKRVFDKRANYNINVLNF